MLGGFTPDGFNALFADGSVRYIKKSINPATLKALITRNGGEVISSRSLLTAFVGASRVPACRAGTHPPRDGPGSPRADPPRSAPPMARMVYWTISGGYESSAWEALSRCSARTGPAGARFHRCRAPRERAIAASARAMPDSHNTTEDYPRRAHGPAGSPARDSFLPDHRIVAGGGSEAAGDAPAAPAAAAGGVARPGRRLRPVLRPVVAACTTPESLTVLFHGLLLACWS